MFMVIDCKFLSGDGYGEDSMVSNVNDKATNAKLLLSNRTIFWTDTLIN